MDTRTSSLANPAKYLFDEVFALEVGAPRAAPPAEHVDLDALIAAARRQAYEEGLVDGRRAAVDDLNSRLADTAQCLVHRISLLHDAAKAEHHRLEQEAIALALAAARRIAPALLARQPLAEVEDIVRNCLTELRSAPHLVVRVAEALVDPMRERLEPLRRQAGFTGQVLVLGDPEIAEGDGRIDWADGGIVRDRAAIEAALESAVTHYLAASPPQADAGNQNDG